MSNYPMPIDISSKPDLIRLVEEIKNSNQPRILKQDDEPVAMLMPMKTAADKHQTIEPFTFQSLRKIKGTLQEAGYPEAEITDMLEALSELPQYAGKNTASK